MTTLRVPDMHCEKCVARITNALDGAGLKFSVSLEDKTVTVLPPCFTRPSRRRVSAGTAIP